MSLIGPRIKQARLRQRMSQRVLAEQSGVSATAISKYERGLMKPTSDVLLKVADALEVDLSFFLRPQRVKEIQPAYRKLKRLGKKSEYQLIERIRDWLERYLEAEEIVEPTPAAFKVPEGFPFGVDVIAQAEEAANLLRKVWELGIDPIEDLTAVLEKRGIRVGVIQADEDFDACTFQTDINGAAPVIITRKGVPGDRQRFSIAHEIGHLLLEISDDLNEEKVCDRFAGALLAPGEALLHDSGKRRRHITVEELLLLKHTYGISMRALTYRFRDLGITSEYAHTEAQRQFARYGWIKKEPGEQVEPETPQRLRMLVLRALGEELISERRARELYGGPIATEEENLMTTF